jgi:hypothetical protein
LTAGNVSHSSIDGKMVTCNTGAIVVSVLSLPSGASTEAKQDANNASIAKQDDNKQDKTLITATNTALAGVITGF